MTINGGIAHPVGDRGQRYEVTFFDSRQQVPRVLGWSEHFEGAQKMIEAIKLHPAWTDPKIRDRQLNVTLRPEDQK